MMRVAILGFGLIGGSLALAARAGGAVTHVTAVDLPDAIRSDAAERSADALVDVTDASALQRALSGCDLAVLAGPVRVILEQLPLALLHAPIVTDCGSTKRVVAAAARASARSGRFVPGHPMAGSPSGGLSSAHAGLFQGNTWLLCPEGVEPDALGAVEALVTRVGARVVHLSPEEHDAAVSRTSHVPQLLASALAVIGNEHAARGASGPAFERATRAAGGAENMWHDIFRTNADEIAAALRELQAELTPIAEELEAAAGGKSERADALLARARRMRRSRPA